MKNLFCLVIPFAVIIDCGLNGTCHQKASDCGSCISACTYLLSAYNWLLDKFTFIACPDFRMAPDCQERALFTCRCKWGVAMVKWYLRKLSSINETSLLTPSSSPQVSWDPQRSLVHRPTLCNECTVPLGTQRPNTRSLDSRAWQRAGLASTFRWELLGTRQLSTTSGLLGYLRRKPSFASPFGGHGFLTGHLGWRAHSLSPLSLNSSFNSCFLFLLAQFCPFCSPSPPAVVPPVCSKKGRWRRVLKVWGMDKSVF